MTTVSLVVAMAHKNVIGRDNGLPWGRLPEDLKHFKAVTMGKPVLMGRKTFESIGKPLPGRTNFVLTRDAKWKAEGVVVVHSLDEALTGDELSGIGGAEIYRLLLPLARPHLPHPDRYGRGRRHGVSRRSTIRNGCKPRAAISRPTSAIPTT